MRLVEWNRPVNGQPNKVAANYPFTGLMENIFGHELLHREHALYVPAVNIREEEQSYILELSAPGYQKENFKLAIEKETLVVSGKHTEEKEAKEQKFSRKEFSYGSFQRAFKLPKNVNESAIAAKYENGILIVTLPKKAEDAKENREIKID